MNKNVIENSRQSREVIKKELEKSRKTYVNSRYTFMIFRKYFFLIIIVGVLFAYFLDSFFGPVVLSSGTGAVSIHFSFVGLLVSCLFLFVFLWFEFVCFFPFTVSSFYIALYQKDWLKERKNDLIQRKKKLSSDMQWMKQREQKLLTEQELLETE